MGGIDIAFFSFGMVKINCTENNTTEIYTFVKLLNALDFQIAISPKETE